MPLALRISSSLALLWSIIFFVACDEERFGARYPVIQVTPNPIAIAAPEVGNTTSRILTVRNAGTGAELIIRDIAFSNSIDEREFSIEHPPLPIEIPMEEEITITLNYAPLNAGVDSGALLFDSNDATNPILSVPIATTSSDMNLIANPERLQFYSADGDSVREQVEVYNLGSIPVTISDWSLSDDSSEEFSIVTPSMPTLLGESGEMVIEIEYTPADVIDDYGTLVLNTDSEVQPRLTVQLVGAIPSPDIFVTPDSIAFGAIDMNEESERERVIVENRGTQPLIISRIGLAAATPPPNNEQFTIHDIPEFVDGTISIEPNNSIEFTVSYHPRVEGRHATAIVIENNDVDSSIFTIPITGRVRQPCIQVIPEEVSFGVVARGIESSRQVLNVVNCGDLPLNVERLSIDDPDFDWTPLEGAARENVDLGPLETMVIEVWYTNRTLGEGVTTEAVLTVTSNSPDTPNLEVPLAVTGGGQPTCTLTVLPRRVNFGLVARGRTVTRELNLLNRGTGYCEVTNQDIVPLFDIPIPGFNEVRFHFVRRVPQGRIAPGAMLPLEIVYRPQIYGADAAKLQISYNDPFLNEDRIAEADLSGVGGDSSISVIPGRLDFGSVTAGDCASREERITVYNTGIVNLCITDVRLEGPACPEFLVTDRPIANQDGCILVTRNQPAEIRLQYEPTNLGGDECELVFESDANNAPELRVPLLGEGVADSSQVDEFVQTSGQTVDVLFVVDNSGSMSEEQRNLRDNFRNFIQGAQQFANDFQLGIVTTDVDDADEAGKLQGDPRIMRRGPQVEDQFQNSIEVGTRGSGTERGLEAAEKALRDPLIFDTGVACQANADCVEPDVCVEGICGGYNRGFLREEAALEIIFVSDEDDSSTATLNYYVDFFKNIKGFRNEGRFHAHAIVGSDNGRAANCDSELGSATPGRAYVEVANRTNGGVHSICEGDFGQVLQEIGNQAFGLPVQFFLSRPAREASIRVSVNGQARADGWEYDEDSNSVIFDQNRVPQPEERVRVEYDAQCFPRRG